MLDSLPLTSEQGIAACALKHSKSQSWLCTFPTLCAASGLLLIHFFQGVMVEEQKGKSYGTVRDYISIV